MEDRFGFDPRKFVDRECELELFENLLRLSDHRRILAIQDLGGTGKTQLLRRFEYRCRTVKPRTPVSFVDLDGKDSETVIRVIKKDLELFKLKFPSFNRYDFARIRGEFTSFLNSGYFEDADLKVPSSVRIEKPEVIQVSKIPSFVGERIKRFTPKQEEWAQAVCNKAFFDDLRSNCEKTPIILLFDRYETCEEELRNWIERDLFPLGFFDLENRPKKLILILAGRKIPDFTTDWAQEDVDAVVESVKELSKWKKEHVEECLRIHGFKYEPKQLDALYLLIKSGLPPSEVVQSIELIMEKRRAET
ncbi:MAG: hypothetical protein ACFFCW_00045 [Candidatus Hodarchaeota archaeon]